MLDVEEERANKGKSGEAPIRKGRKRLWRHWERGARGDEARRRGRLTRLMSSPLPCQPLPSDPQRLCHASSLLTRPRFLLALASCLNHPPLGPSSDYCFVAPMAVPLGVSSTLFFFFPKRRFSGLPPSNGCSPSSHRHFFSFVPLPPA